MILRLRAYAEMNRFDAIDNVLKGNTLKKLNLTPLNLAELYVDYKKYDKAVEYIKQITESDYFDYKIEMLKYMEKYSDALECIISDKDCDRKDMLVNDILAKKPDLRTKADGLFAEYGH
jgi:tetratricopeptide (TPR) repeat protein